jgi:Domain of Unknown Function (DUF1080)
LQRSELTLFALGACVNAPGLGRLADPTKFSNSASELTVGFNWYLNSLVRMQFNWEHAWFGQPVLLGPPKTSRKLRATDGQGAYYNGAKGRTANLYTKEKYGDLEVHLEFMVSKSSNSGIKFHGHYEIQIVDSFDH